MKMRLNVCEITSLDLPDLEPYRTLRRPLEHQKQGIFVAEGEKVVGRLLESGLPIISMLMTRQWFERIFAQSKVEAGDSFTVYLAERKLLETIAGFSLHQAIMAVGRVPAEAPMEAALLSFARPHLLVALDGIVSAENVGVIIRNCAAFGVHGILVGETSSSPYLRRAVRNSMGAIFRLPVFTLLNLAESLRSLQQEWGTKVVAAHPGGGVGIYDADLSGSLCLVFGNEGSGISDPVLNACTMRVAIPMMNETDSLNVSNATAVFLYEVIRQRRN